VVAGEPSGAERYLEERLRDAEYREAYERALRQVTQADRVINELDKRRQELRLSKAELARRADMPPEAIRRLFSAKHRNPTLQTLVAVADALGLQLLLVLGEPATTVQSSATQELSDASETHRRTA
jgi:DNA-binding phage protein